MSETTTTPIDTVLLATDLGFRCDRAAARAARFGVAKRFSSFAWNQCCSAKRKPTTRLVITAIDTSPES